MPEATPLRSPAVPIVAIDVLALLQVPLPVALLRVVVPPTHTGVVLVIAAGAWLTETTVVAAHPLTV